MKTDTATLWYKGWKCNIYFNYVSEGELGIGVHNAWAFNAEGEVDGVPYILADEYLRAEVKTLEEAIAVIRPGFEMAVDRSVVE